MNIALTINRKNMCTSETVTDKPKVLNKHHVLNIPNGSVYIGRGSKWGNPFIINQHGNRAEVIAQYEQHLKKHPELIESAKKELAGKNLVCFCSPQACHGDILLAIANPELETSNG